MKEKRRDSKGRILHTGESQRTDGKYLYKYVDAFGNTKYVYAWRLTPTDPTPKGKREKPSLRELEQQIRRDIEDKELVVSTLGVLYTNEDDVDSVDLSERIPITPLVAYGYMLFVLIYFPCIATLAAIKQESGGWKWAIFAATYTTVLAWIVSFGVYQIGSLFI